jgi:HSP20 family protein
MEAAGASGTTGSRAGSETGGSSTASKNAPPQGTEQGRTQTTKETETGSEQQQGQVRGRLSRREGWEDQGVGPFFGGSPFALFRRLSDDMDRLFFGGGPSLGAFSNLGGRFVPNVDVDEHEDKIVVRADLPGVRADDFRVDIEDDALVLQGERRIEREETHGGVRRVERSQGSFRRIIPLPQAANLEAAEARFENGVLEIVIPIQKETKSRRLEVRSTPGTSSDPTRH